MFVTKKRYKDLSDAYDEHIRLTNEKILKGNDRIITAENEARHLRTRLELETHLLEQERVAKMEAKADAADAKDAFRVLHRIITEFRATPSRNAFNSIEIGEIERVAIAMRQSMKEWL